MTTCLIADESVVIRMVARKILADLNIDVVEAADFDAALTSCRAAMPAVVLIESQIKDVSAQGFVADLRELPEGHDVRVIYCTSSDEMADIQAAYDDGADDYVIKPFDGEVLYSKFLRLGLLPEGAA